MLTAKRLRSHIGIQAGLELDKIIPVKNIPRTTSGKLQRFKLITQYFDGEFNAVEAELDTLLQRSAANDKPADEFEERLLKIWKTVLGTDTIGVNQSFFEMGGNSLKATETVMMIFKSFQVEVSADMLYEHQTIRSFKKVIEKSSKTQYREIALAAKNDTYPLSSAQRRLFYAYQADKSSRAYNLPIAFRIKGKLELTKLECAVQGLVQRHDTLRMSFHQPSDPVLKISNKIPVQLKETEVSEEEIREVLKNMVRPFQLELAPLFRIELLKISGGDFILFLDFHHIISDGLSISNLVKELVYLYRGEELSELKVGYKDFAEWEKDTLISDAMLATHEEYWKQVMNDIPLLELPIDYERPVVFDTEGEKTEFVIDELTTGQLRDLAKINGCTLHALMCAIYGIVLSKYTGEGEVVFGIPVTHRPHVDLQHIHGLFVNNLPVRVHISETSSFTDALLSISANIQESLKHRAYPFEYMVSRFTHSRDASRNPVFDSMFNFQNMDMPVEKIEDGLTLSRYFFDPGFSKFDLSMEIFDEGSQMSYSIEYAKRLFSKETILKFKHHFERLIKEVISNPYRTVSDIPLIDKNEYKQLVESYNQTEQNFKVPETIHEWFDVQAFNTPDSIALEFNGTIITYRELQNKTNELSNRLISDGIGNGDIVSVLLERSPYFVVSVLAIMKTGAAFLPLSTDFPSERISYVLEHSGCKMLISDSNNQSRLSLETKDIKLLLINELQLKGTSLVSSIACHPHDTAYVIYTSGTTGRPKGVMVSHGALTNYIAWASEKYIADGACNFPLFTPLSFDLTITSLFTPLVTGNTLVIYEDDPKRVLLERVIEDDKVHIVKLTPSHLKMVEHMEVAGSNRNLKAFIVGGEAFNMHTANVIYQKFQGRVSLYNEYGPTEATVGCMLHKYDPEENNRFVTVPIGLPAANTSIYLLDKHLKPVPFGVYGEIYIGGKGLSKGYLNDETLTDKLFVTNPFGTGKIYKTGDVARRLSTGIVIYNGRYDEQLKLNGYRIEPAEIEIHLREFPEIKEGVATAKTVQGKIVLCAYYTAGSVVDDSQLRVFLAKRLPYYMMPVYFIRINDIPLSSNGKVDLSLLPAPELRNEPVDVLEADPLQKVLIKVWNDVFNRTDLGLDDNFYEIGGDSIKAVQIVSRLIDEDIEINTRDILTYQTIRQIAMYGTVEQSYSTNYEQGLMEGSRNLLPIESWFFKSNFSNINYYNQSILLKVRKDLKIDKLSEAFNHIIVHHDGLRSNYIPAQNIMFYNKDHCDKPFEIATYDLLSDNKSLAEVCIEVKSSFDTTKDLLIKAAIIKNESETDLLITAHHLIVDGISWRILLTDLKNAYDALVDETTVELSRKTASLSDWSDAINKYIDSSDFKYQLPYWKEVIKEPFAIPVDREITTCLSKDTCKITRTLDSERTGILLKDAHKLYRTDVPILLNVALALTLKEKTGQNTFVIEQESHGRHLPHVDTSKTIGWFTGIFPIKIYLPQDTLDNQIIAIKQQFEQVPDHGIGYLMALNSGLLDVQQKAQIRLNYLGQFDDELDNDLFSFKHTDTGGDIDGSNEVTTHLEINCMGQSGEFQWILSYNSKAYLPESMEAFADTFFHNLNSVLDYLVSNDASMLMASNFDTSLNAEDLQELFG